jgi:hypothetical protein
LDVQHALERVHAERSELPFVLSLDDGSDYRERTYCAWVKQHRVLELRSPPHVPQHNAFAERAHGELEEVSGLWRGGMLDDVAEARARLDAACDRFNCVRRPTS